MEAVYRVQIDGFTTAPGLNETIVGLERVNALLSQLDKQKDILNKATTTKGAAGAVNEIEKTTDAITQEKIALAELEEQQAKAAKAVLQLEKVKRQEQAAIEKANQKIREESGLLGKLRSDIQRLNSLRWQATTPAQIERINRLLDAQRQRLSQLQNAGRQATNTFGNALGSFQFKFNFLGNLFASATTGLADTLFTFGKEAVELAAKAEGIERAFNRLNNPGLLDELRKATQGTVSDLSLMQVAVKANNFKIPLDQLGKLLKFAQIRAQETGESVDYLAESIVLGISRKSIPILDNLGLSATQIQQEFKKTGDFAKGVGNIIDEELRKAGDQSLTTAGKLQRITAIWENFKVMVGEYLINEGAQFLDYWDMLTGKVSIAEAGFRKLNNGMAEIAVRQNNEFLDTIKNKSAQEQLADAYGRRSQLYGELSAQLTRFNKESKNWSAEEVAGAQTVINYTQKKIDLLGLFIDRQTKVSKATGDAEAQAAINLKSNFELEKIRAQERFNLQMRAIENSSMLEADAHVATISAREELAKKLADIEKRSAQEEAAFRIKDINASADDENKKAAAITEINHNLAQNLKNIKEQLRIDIEKINYDELEATLSASADEAERLNKLDEEKAKKAKDRAQKLAQDKLAVNDQLFEAEQRQLQRDRDNGMISERKRQELEIEMLRDHLQRRSQVLIDERDKEIDQIEADRSAGIISLEEYETRKRKVIEESGKELEALTDDIAEKERTYQREKFEQLVSEATAFVNAVSDAYEKAQEKRIDQLEQQGDKQQDIIDEQRARAIAGQSNSLAAEESQAAAIERAQAEQQRRLERIKKLEAFFNLFAEFAKQDPDTALQKALTQVGTAEALSLLFAEKGGMVGDVKDRTQLTASGLTKSHGSGNDVMVVASPNEGILTESEVKTLGGRAGFYDLKRMLAAGDNPIDANAFGRQSEAFSATYLRPVVQPDQNKEVVNKIDELITVAKNPPVDTVLVDSIGNLLHYVKKNNQTTITRKTNIRKAWLD